MRPAKTLFAAFLLLVGVGCNDGSKSVTGAGGSTGSAGGANGAGMGGNVGAGGSTGTGGSVAADGSVGTGGSVGSGGAGGASDGLRSGPFKMLVLSKTLEFAHASIAAGQQMLRDLGATPDANLPSGAKAGSQFTVTIANVDLSDFTDANLKSYEVIFWMNPTGTVFTSGGANGVTGKAAVQKFMENGGAWAGVHSATDFEKTSQWTWFQDLVGGYFVSHDNAGSPGSVVVQPAAISMDHPITRGLPSPWSCNEEWYFMNRNPETLVGYTILAKLAVDQRPVAWIHEIAGGGRTFYTIRGHDISAYAEPNFRRLVHQGILWAVHRMK
jgi:type 1 glutamine amidotransferase